MEFECLFETKKVPKSSHSVVTYGRSSDEKVRETHSEVIKELALDLTLLTFEAPESELLLSPYHTTRHLSERLIMDLLNGYGSSSDEEDDTTNTIQIPPSLTTTSTPTTTQITSTNESVTTHSTTSTTDTNQPSTADEEEARRKRQKKEERKEKKEKKEKKKAAAAATPKLVLPSAAALLSGISDSAMGLNVPIEPDTDSTTYTYDPKAKYNALPPPASLLAADRGTDEERFKLRPMVFDQTKKRKFGDDIAAARANTDSNATTVTPSSSSSSTSTSTSTTSSTLPKSSTVHRFAPPQVVRKQANLSTEDIGGWNTQTRKRPSTGATPSTTTTME